MKKLFIIILAAGAILGSMLLLIDHSASPDDQAKNFATKKAGAAGVSTLEHPDSQALGMPTEKDIGSDKGSKAGPLDNHVHSAREGTLSQGNHRDSVASNSEESRLTPSTSRKAETSRDGSNVRDAFLRVMDNSLEQRYSRYFETVPLPLSEAQRTSVMAILSQETAGRYDILDGPQRDSLTSNQKRELIYQNKQLAEQNLNAILPADDMAALAEYRASQPFRMMAEDAVALSAKSGVAFSPQQVDDLTKILRQADVFFYSGPVPQLTIEEYNLTTQNDAKAVAGAAKILTPEQLELFKKSLAGRVRVRN